MLAMQEIFAAKSVTAVCYQYVFGTKNREVAMYIGCAPFGNMSRVIAVTDDSGMPIFCDPGSLGRSRHCVLPIQLPH